MIFKTELRGCDEQGCGEYGAERGKKIHRGLDIRCFEGQKVYSPINGIINKVGFSYRQTDEIRKHFRYVEIKATENFKLRIHYVSPEVEKDDVIMIGGYIGSQQELGKIYKGIREHVHIELFLNRKRVDPTSFYQTRCLS